ncbi:DNA polymerase Y family protein [Acidovorax sp. D2M1]|uniref:DNA polymerase Y family protein n=1 Tax=Acidovorax benzenivorans TaxID=2987520 RepID=A0ABT5S3R4_9BURK|nr:DNA polymerase Y family protein [Acidovorax benzenivorans]MDD2179783.1 DNA polymerase Y family protein [Acidovorax benzenivorans]
MHWIALPLPWCDEAAASAGTGTERSTDALNAAAGWWALRFTPRVALADGEAVLLEVSTTERLWGGREALQALVLQAWADASARGVGDSVANQPINNPEKPVNPCGSATAKALSPGAPAVWGTGPTALVAQAWLRMALAGHPCPPQGRVENLPLHTLAALRPHVASLERMGCRTWGTLRALPRAGVARRLGAGVLRVLDQALGHAPEAHAWLQLPEQFVLTTELPALAESADALLWSASRCLTALQAWLQARQQGVLALELAWRHDLRRMDGVVLPPTQALQVRTAQATHDLAHLRRLLAENLARTTLAAPVNQITLRLLDAAPLPHRSASLLPPGDVGGRDLASHGSADPADAPGEALHQLLERLSARLGADHVVAPVLLADHRPERMQQWRAAAEVLGAPSTATRTPASSASVRADDASQGIAPDAPLLPTWLLNPPPRLVVQGNRPCHHGLLRLLAGPHRFEAGWWSATDDAVDPAHPCAGLALRDYFVAHNDVVGLVWVFRERLAPALDGTQAPARPHRWFLHGIFG